MALKTSRMSVSRLRPPDLAVGIIGPMIVHSASLQSLGYRPLRGLCFSRWSLVHMAAP
jgi:hypothetical protein